MFRSPDLPNPALLALALMAVAPAAVQEMALLLAHTPTPGLPTSLALLALLISAQIGAPVSATAGTLDGLNTATNNLTRALTAAAMSEQQRIEQSEKTAAAFTQAMSAALQRLNEGTQILNMTLQSLQRPTDGTRPR